MNFEDGDDYFDFRPMAIAGGVQFAGTDVAFSGGGAKQVRALSTADGWLLQVDLNGDRRADMSISVSDPDHSIIWGNGDFLFV